LQDEHLFAGFHHFQPLPDLHLLPRRAVAEAAYAGALLFDLPRHVRILLFVVANQAAFLHESGNSLRALQRNKRITGQ